MRVARISRVATYEQPLSQLGDTLFLEVSSTNGAKRIFRDVRVDSVLTNLPEIITGLARVEGRSALVVEDDRRRYVQFMLTLNGELIVECISNRYLDSQQQHTAEDEDQLRAIGFHPAEVEPEPHPNWWWQGAFPGDLLKACRMAARALSGVLDLDDRSRVMLIEEHWAVGEIPRESSP
jgi:hypothetical protein